MPERKYDPHTPADFTYATGATFMRRETRVSYRFRSARRWGGGGGKGITQWSEIEPIAYEEKLNLYLKSLLKKKSNNAEPYPHWCPIPFGG